MNAMSPGLKIRVEEAAEILREAGRTNNPRYMIGMFSGGHDSLCATHVASQSPDFSFAAHMNTTIGIEQTRDFVRRVSSERMWNLHEYRPPVSYRDIVLQKGFPGPGAHFYMYVRLKERCVDQMLRELPRTRGRRVLLVTGVRLSESKRRMGHVQPIKRESSKVWVAPILNWDNDHKDEYMRLHNLPRNPVVDTLCMSGECLCGAFASPGEIAEIEAAFPEVAAEIHALERDAELAGVHAKWGTRPPGVRAKKLKSGAMCSSCADKFEDTTPENWDAVMNAALNPEGQT